MTPRPLDGPRLAPAAPPAESLVVFVHGYGADGNDLIGLGSYWRGLLTRTAFVSPHAPERCAMNPMGYQWWGIERRNEEEALAGVRRAAPLLDAFIDGELERAGLGDDRLALVGFSQGTMLSLHVGLRRARPPAAILGYSGMMIARDRLKAEIKVRPPVLLIHGDEDPMIPAAATELAAAALGEAGVLVQWHISTGIGHSIAEDGLKLGGRFLAEALSGRLRPQG